MAGSVCRCLLLGPRSLLIDERLQDEGCGDLVDDAAMVLADVAGLIEYLVGFARGEALVPQVNGQAGERAKLGGECLRFDGLRADVAGEVDGVANNYADDAEAAAEAGERTEIFSGNAGCWATPFQGEDWLGGEAEFVGDSDADAAVADVESEIAGDGLQVSAPGF
jgi:hypothetical protein